MRKGALIVLSGFSGAGKGTIVRELLKRYDDFALSISMTSRGPRPGEKDGREYFFVTKEKFEETIASDGLLEYACYCDNYYGTPKAYVNEQLANGRDVILEIEIQGAMKIKEKFPGAILLFVMPPSAEVLYNRLVGRGTETPEVILQRMTRAVEESKGIEQYDYIIVNDELDACVTETYSIIQAAHRDPNRNMEFIDTVRTQLKEMKAKN